MDITPETTAYLNGEGTREQQELFQRAADRIDTLHAEDGEDAKYLAQDELVGAAMYSLGDATLAGLGTEAARIQRQATEAWDRLAGAMIAAHVDGATPTQIKRETGVSRTTVYKRLGL